MPDAAGNPPGGQNAHNACNFQGLVRPLGAHLKRGYANTQELTRGTGYLGRHVPNYWRPIVTWAVPGGALRPAAVRPCRRLGIKHAVRHPASLRAVLTSIDQRPLRAH